MKDLYDPVIYISSLSFKSSTSHFSSKWSTPKGCLYFFTAQPKFVFILTTLIFISALSIMTSFANSIVCFFFILFEICIFFNTSDAKNSVSFFHLLCTFLIVLLLTEFPVIPSSSHFPTVCPSLNVWSSFLSILPHPPWLMGFSSILAQSQVVFR